MIKSFIAPLQNWLLSQERCVGCGMPLAKLEKRLGKNKAMIVVCKCRRIYVYTESTKSYRRALISEVA